MINILVDQMPEAVVIDGVEHDINCDFRTCLRAIMAFEDSDLVYIEQQSILLTLLYPVLPANEFLALEMARKFLNGGIVERANDEEDEPEESGRYFSFTKDSRFIFAAFKQTHNIDIDSVQLHWWKFIALFMDIGQDTFFCQLTALRKRVKTGRATKEERELSREMGSIFELSELDTRSIEERMQEAEFMRLVNLSTSNN